MSRDEPDPTTALGGLYLEARLANDLRNMGLGFAGETSRVLLACHALNGILAHHGCGDQQAQAEWAVRYADEVMRYIERNP